LHFSTTGSILDLEGFQMKRPYILLLTILALTIVIPFALPAAEGPKDSGVPKMTVVTPDTGKAGDLLTVEGEYLGKPSVVELFLTDGTNDWKCEIVEQSETSIKFKIPAKAKPSRLSLMVLTGGSPPKLIEEPVKVTVQ
jgi:hypothetical protein